MDKNIELYKNYWTLCVEEESINNKIAEIKDSKYKDNRTFTAEEDIELVKLYSLLERISSSFITIATELFPESSHFNTALHHAKTQSSRLLLDGENLKFRVLSYYLLDNKNYKETLKFKQKAVDTLLPILENMLLTIEDHTNYIGSREIVTNLFESVERDPEKILITQIKSALLEIIPDISKDSENEDILKKIAAFLKSHPENETISKDSNLIYIDYTSTIENRIKKTENNINKFLSEKKGIKLGNLLRDILPKVDEELLKADKEALETQDIKPLYNLAMERKKESEKEITNSSSSITESYFIDENGNATKIVPADTITSNIGTSSFVYYTYKPKEQDMNEDEGEPTAFSDSFPVQFEEEEEEEDSEDIKTVKKLGQIEAHIDGLYRFVNKLDDNEINKYINEIRGEISFLDKVTFLYQENEYILEKSTKLLEQLEEVIKNLYSLIEKNGNDPVNHPKHYTQHPSGVECVEITELLEGSLANVVKYLWRAGLKDNKTLSQDIEKAEWYLNRYIELVDRRLNGEDTVNTLNDKMNSVLNAEGNSLKSYILEFIPAIHTHPDNRIKKNLCLRIMQHLKKLKGEN